MAKFLATNGVSYLLEGILMDAKESLTIVNPHIKMTKTFWEKLKDSQFRKVDTRIVFSKLDLSKSQKKAMASWTSCKLYEIKNLGTKCYFNEKLMVLSSMDIWDTENVNERNMGIMIDLNKDQNLYRQAQLEVASIINASKPINLADGSFEVVMAN